MMQMHAPRSETGQIEELDWTSKEPLDRMDFLDAEGNLRLSDGAPKLSRPPPDPTAPPTPTGGPATPPAPT